MRRACLLLFALAGCSAKSGDSPPPAPQALVKTAAAMSTTLSDTIVAYGGAEFLPAGERTLTAPVEAVVVDAKVAVGDPVRQGQPLLTLAPSPTARLDLERAQKDAETASAAYARAARLRSTGLNSDAEVETARSAAATANATAQSLRARAAGTQIVRAPISGVVETLTAAPGELAAAGAPLAKIGALNALRVRLGIDAQTATRVRPGAPIQLQPMQGGVAVSAVVEAVDPRADPQTRLASILARVPAAARFAPGEPLQGRITVSEHTGVVAVPRASLLYAGDQPYLFVVYGKTAHKRAVTVGLEDQSRAEITRGVQAGDRVIVEGGTALEDGMAVREVSATGARP